MARQYANSLGYDEAILIDRDLNISETSTGSLLFSDSEGWLTPESFFQLPGITISQVKLLASEQQGVRVQNITINSLNNIDKAFVINSLTGLIPVKRINEMSLREVDSDYAEQINSALFS